MNDQSCPAVTIQPDLGALGHEVITMTTHQQVDQLLADVTDENAAIADLARCLERIKTAQAAKEVLAGLPAAQVRAALEARRAAGEHDRRRPR